ncbi:hypothetical protein GCK32_015585, partial [Trichostrongylus colubriformis]
MERAKPLILIFLMVLVLGLAAMVVLVIVISASSAEYQADTDVMYFAMNLGDPDNPTPRALWWFSAGNRNCSLQLNIDNTRESIRVMEEESLSLRYSFILYEDVANATSPMSAEEAFSELKKIRSTKSGKRVRQASAIEKFMQLRSATRNDLFLFYVPCVLRDDPDDLEDMKKFKEDMEGLHGKMVIISSTMPEKNVSFLYNENLKNVIGEEDDVVNRVANIVRDNERTTTRQTTAITTTEATLITSEAWVEPEVRAGT